MKALDLFCGAGGAAIGLLQAGFDAVVGVDVDARCAPVYPGEFVRGDVFGAVALLLLESGEFDLVWASPPCQRWASPTALTRAPDGGHRPSAAPDLVAATRSLVAPHPCTILENVPRAPIRCDVALTGPMCGLPRLWRRRHFETTFFSTECPATRPAGSVATGTLVSVTTQGGIPCRHTRAKRGEARPDLQSSRFTRQEMLGAMGLPGDCGWTMRQIGEAVPPAYARAMGALALDWLGRK